MIFQPDSNEHQIASFPCKSKFASKMLSEVLSDEKKMRDYGMNASKRASTGDASWREAAINESRSSNRLII